VRRGAGPERQWRDALHAICEEARAESVVPERRLVEVKQALGILCDRYKVPPGPARTESTSRVVTLIGIPLPPPGTVCVVVTATTLDAPTLTATRRLGATIAAPTSGDSLGAASRFASFPTVVPGRCAFEGRFRRPIWFLQ
jgi:hypothetical protein